MTNDSRNTPWYVVLALLLAFLVVGVAVKLPNIANADSDGRPDASSTTGLNGEECEGSEAQFFAYLAAQDDLFGPAVQRENLHAAVNELFDRMSCDPLLASVTEAHASNNWLDANALYNRAQNFLRDRGAWNDSIAYTHSILDNCTPRFSHRDNSYMTLGMRRGANPQIMPTLFQANPNRPTFATLEFVNCANNTTVVFKLDCGFQPVRQYFYTITLHPAPPGDTPSISPPGTNPPGTNPPGSTTTTVPPTTTTVPPTTTTVPPCPFYAYCEDPSGSIHNQPDPNGNTGTGTPDVPVSQQPTPAVAPPAEPPPPPPVYTVPSTIYNPPTPVTSPPNGGD